MLSIPRANAILRTASDCDSLTELLRDLGFSGELLELSERARHKLGLPDAVEWARVTRGVGSLRGLAIGLSGSSSFREIVTAVAERLTTNSPQLLWLVVAVRAEKRELGVVCWSSSASGVRLASLVCNQERVFESDAETLCALAAAMCGTDLLAHNHWLETLGREAITRRFFRVLQGVVTDLAVSLPGNTCAADRRELALLAVSRLIFLSFLETKGWLDSDFAFLSNGFAACADSGGQYHKRVLAPLFFGTLNTRISKRSARALGFGRIPFLNGGLFARSPLEKKYRESLFSDEQLGNVFGSLLTRYRFTPREDTHDWSEASIDPEILGKAFEALMNAVDRKTSGAFYTPQALVRDLTERAVNACAETFDLAALQRFRVLDPACGSGAFLVHALERLAVLRSEYGEPGSLGELRRRVLATSIFGVDNNPMAVWLCELRLWLSIVIESPDADPMRIVPLPNLDRNIRVGDSLAGGAFADADLPLGSRKFATLRARYIRAVGPRKRTLSRALDRCERTTAIELLVRDSARLKAERKELLVSVRGRDLFGERTRPGREVSQRLSVVRESLRVVTRRTFALRGGAALPFSFASHFADVRDAGGFHLVIGNPPWVRIHHIAQASREKLKHDFQVYRQAAWESGAASAGAGKGFAAQIDLAALFIERSTGLLREDGVLGLMLPSKLWGSLAGGGVRRFLLERSTLVELEDLSAAGSQFDAAVYPSMLIARARRLVKATDARNDSSKVSVAVHSKGRAVRWESRPMELAFDNTPGSPWLLVPPCVRQSFDAVTKSGIPLFQSGFGRPALGVKTGFNQGYLVQLESLNGNGEVASIKSVERTGTIESELLRPVARGENLQKWRIAGEGERIIWPYLSDGSQLRALPQLARNWLAPHRSTLERRTDLNPSDRWWSVFRTEAARNDAPRVAWADFGLSPRAIAIAAGDSVIPLNTCYVVRCPTITDAHALATLLNSPLITAWLNVIAEPARGGYRRYLGWTMALLPVPIDWEASREALAELGERASREGSVSNDVLLAATLQAYGLGLPQVEPLLSWRTPSD